MFDKCFDIVTDVPKDNPLDNVQEMGKAIFNDCIATAKGLNTEWTDIDGGGQESFTAAYESYIQNPTALKEQYPAQYYFIKDHVFYGKEFAEANDVKEAANESTEDIGDPEDWAQKLDWKQGDNIYGVQGDCGVVSCGNILTEAGFNIDESAMVKYAVENGLCYYDSNDMEKSGGTTAEQQAEILTGAGVPAHAEYNVNLNDISDAIASGKGVIVEINAGVLWDDGNYYGDGSSNHAITVTGEKIDPSTGEVLGYYVCDSGKGEASSAGEFISTEKMEQMWECNGTNQAVITDNPIKNA